MNTREPKFQGRYFSRVRIIADDRGDDAQTVADDYILDVRRADGKPMSRIEVFEALEQVMDARWGKTDLVLLEWQQPNNGGQS